MIDQSLLVKQLNEKEFWIKKQSFLKKKSFLKSYSLKSASSLTIISDFYFTNLPDDEIAKTSFKYNMDSLPYRLGNNLIKI